MFSLTFFVPSHDFAQIFCDSFFFQVGLIRLSFIMWHVMLSFFHMTQEKRRRRRPRAQGNLDSPFPDP
jgi:hypothetical protein